MIGTKVRCTLWAVTVVYTLPSAEEQPKELARMIGLVGRIFELPRTPDSLQRDMRELHETAIEATKDSVDAWRIGHCGKCGAECSWCAARRKGERAGCRPMMPPDTRGLGSIIVVGLVAIPFALWKLAELVVWFFSHLRWI